MTKPVLILTGVAAIAVAMVAGALIANGLSDDDDDPDVVTVAGNSAVADDGPGADQVAIDADDGTVDADDQVVEVDDQPLSNAELQKLKQAALVAAGGGTVTDAGRSDDPGETYEVEVIRGAREIDLAFDSSFERVPNAPYGDD